MTDLPPSLAEGALEIVSAEDTGRKVELAYALSHAWFSKGLTRVTIGNHPKFPDRPGRPDRPVLLPPREMPRRSMGSQAKHIAFVHSIAHIELNAVDLTWDLIGRFAHVPMPRSYFNDWVKVGLEEAKHFAMLERRLKDLGSFYGDLPAHDGLWQAAQDTGENHLGRLAIIPLVLEARGLDVTPPMIARARDRGDEQTAQALEIIYRDEKGHVAIGMRWFRFLCDRQGLAPEPTFHALVRRHFKSPLKPPFNDRARSEAGMTSGFFRPLTAHVN